MMLISLIRFHRHISADAATYVTELVALLLMTFEAIALDNERGHQAQMGLTIRLLEFHHFLGAFFKALHCVFFPGIRDVIRVDWIQAGEVTLNGGIFTNTALQ